MSSAGISTTATINQFGLNLCAECDFRFTGCMIKIFHARPAVMIGGISMSSRNKSKCIVNKSDLSEVEFCDELISFCRNRSLDLLFPDDVINKLIEGQP